MRCAIYMYVLMVEDWWHHVCASRAHSHTHTAHIQLNDFHSMINAAWHHSAARSAVFIENAGIGGFLCALVYVCVYSIYIAIKH